MNKTLMVLLLLLLFFVLYVMMSDYYTYEGFANKAKAGTFTGPNGSTITFVGSNMIIKGADGAKVIFSKDTNDGDETSANSFIYVGQDGSIARLNGKTIIITFSDGHVETFEKDDSSATNEATDESSGTSDVSMNALSHPVIFYGPDGGTARIVKTKGSKTIVTTDRNGSTEVYVIGENGKIITIGGKKALQVIKQDGTMVNYMNDVGSSTDPKEDIDVNGIIENMASAFKTNVISGAGKTYSSYDSSGYYNSNNDYSNNAYSNNDTLAKGIAKSMIPEGEEDLYVLKSQIVPPVCPRCPDPVIIAPDKYASKKCPPCPACARCPEASFDCKKVPNYNAFNPGYSPIPVPMVDDFSQF